ncbi:uncharacterized protein LOC104900436 [Beta vulgaris subsp. vulgaris]|uniref:uncharacterized protein LOC104900436 n=1 Tax=Beta vulgaris subsp. vulgaris TaxID=3555 RepID=UPI002547814D|nr:uncharacterized protein LOC104900436 [Beta vulgaris subsp. vulgaris]
MVVSSIHEQMMKNAQDKEFKARSRRLARTSEEMHEEYHDFLSMLGSLDYMHWPWKNCPTAWKGQYTRVSNNDLNVLSKSNLFREKLQGNAPEVDFTVNGSQYTMGYYLMDSIYPEWAAFVKSFPHPQDPKRLCFKRRHESARKDVERAFGVLQAGFTIVKGPVRYERYTYSRNFQDNEFVPQVVGDIQQGHVPNFQAYLATDATIRDRNMHHQFKVDLVEHIWTRFGSEDPH